MEFSRSVRRPLSVAGRPIAAAILALLWGGYFFTFPGQSARAASLPAGAFSDGRKTVTLPVGEYAEAVTVPPGRILSGESRDGVVLSGGVILRNGAVLKNLTVAARGIVVEPDADAVIEDVVVRDTADNAVETTGLGLLEMRRTAILASEKKGAYIRWGKHIAFSELVVRDNREEGIDMRSHIKGFIRDSVVSGNGESGLEIIVGDSRLELVRNQVTGNASSGASFQFYPSSPAPGAVIVSRSLFEKNGKNGVNCNWPNADRVREGYFGRSLLFVENTFSENAKRDIAKACTDEERREGNRSLLEKPSAAEGLPIPPEEKTRLRAYIERGVAGRLPGAERRVEELTEQFEESLSRIESRGIRLKTIGVADDVLDGLRLLRLEHDLLQTEFKDLMQRTTDPAKQERITRRYQDLDRLGQEQDDAIDRYKQLGLLGWFR